MISLPSRPSFARARTWLFTAICFVLPMKASFIYTLSAFLLLAWLLEGGLKDKLREIFRSTLCMAFLGYYLIFIVALLWTQDITKGWAMVDRQTPFLLFLLYWSSADRAYRERYVTALIAGLCVCALLANYNLLQMTWFTDWPRGIRVMKDAQDTAPFVDRILYAPILALGSYFCLSRAFRSRGKCQWISFAVALLLLFNLSFSGGRSGMVMFVAMFAALLFEHIGKPVRALVVCVVILPAIFMTAYKTQSYFAERVDVAISDLRTFNRNPDTSVGLRLVYWTTSFHIFTNHPLIGVGSGDFEREYARAKPAKWAETPDSFNPHNQFLMTGVTTGSLGLALLAAIAYFAVRARSDTRMVAFLIGFAVVCMFESYLWRSNTALTFCAILAALSAQVKDGSA